MSLRDRQDGSVVFEDSHSEKQVPEFKVTCGIRASVQITNDSQRVMGRIVGFSEGEVIILRLAPSHVFKDISINWPDLIMRFAMEGVVYGFKSPMMGTLEQPPMVFVKWPTAVKSVRLRVHERVPCFLNAHLVSHAVRKEVVITDLSAGGCRIALSQDASEMELAVDEQVILELPTTTNRKQALRGRIKSVTKEQNPKCGVMFEDLDQDQQLAIDQLMDDIRAVW